MYENQSFVVAACSSKTLTASQSILEISRELFYGKVENNIVGSNFESGAMNSNMPKLIGCSMEFMTFMKRPVHETIM